MCYSVVEILNISFFQFPLVLTLIILCTAIKYFESGNNFHIEIVNCRSNHFLFTYFFFSNSSIAETKYLFNLWSFEQEKQLSVWKLLYLHNFLHPDLVIIKKKKKEIHVL